MHHVDKLTEFTLSALFMDIGGTVGASVFSSSTPESSVADGKFEFAVGGPDLKLRELEGGKLEEISTLDFSSS